MTYQLFLPGQIVSWKDEFGVLHQGRFIDNADYDHIIVSTEYRIAHVPLAQVES